MYRVGFSYAFTYVAKGEMPCRHVPLRTWVLLLLSGAVAAYCCNPEDQQAKAANTAVTKHRKMLDKRGMSDVKDVSESISGLLDSYAMVKSIVGKARQPLDHGFFERLASMHPALLKLGMGVPESFVSAWLDKASWGLGNATTKREDSTALLKVIFPSPDAGCKGSCLGPLLLLSLAVFTSLHMW